MLDVVVAGAGLAGLTCARELDRAGVAVRVVEARDRVGGRTLSRQLGDHVFDFGGQWILPTQQRMLALADELDIQLVPQFRDGRSVWLRDGVRKVDGGWRSLLPPLHAIELAYRVWKLDRLRARDPDRAGQSFADWIRDNVRARRAAEALTMLTQLSFAVEPHEISLRTFLQTTGSTGGIGRRDQFEGGVVALSCAGGVQQLSQRLAAQLAQSPRLSWPVSAVTVHADRVSVRSDGDELEARRLVLAVPAALVSGLAIDPPLPALARPDLMGPIIKCVATYDRAFWREQGLSGEAYSSDGAVRAVVDVTSADGAQPALLGFIVGDGARHWSKQPAAERRAVVLAQLATLFGESAASPTHYAEHDWLAAKYSDGCVGMFGSDGPADCWETAREPAGHVYFCSSDTAAEWPGHMEGAVEAGQRTALRVLHSLD